MCGNMRNRKLLLDEMLGRSASLLRIFGIDVEYTRPKNDDELILLAKKEKRTLVTRDRPLANKCKKEGVKCLLITSTNTVDQLRQIKDDLHLKFTFPETMRCSDCNTRLRKAVKSEVAGLVPSDVLKNKRRFWLCRKCNKAYWEGSHWKNIVRIYKHVQK